MLIICAIKPQIICLYPHLSQLLKHGPWRRNGVTTPLRLIAGAVVMSEQAATEAKIRAAEWVGQEIEQLGVGIERLIGVGFGVWASGQLEGWK